MIECLFCNYKDDGKGVVIFDGEFCLCIEIVDKELMGGIVDGHLMIIPKRHCESLFEMTSAEWRETQELMLQAKQYMDKKYKPDGYTVGWNVGAVGGSSVPHVHMHIFSRFKDEARAGQGLRRWVKKDNPHHFFTGA